MKYQVMWMVEINAESPEDAATRALEIQKDPNSTALSFDVIVPATYENVQAKIITIDFTEKK